MWVRGIQSRPQFVRLHIHHIQLRKERLISVAVPEAAQPLAEPLGVEHVVIRSSDAAQYFRIAAIGLRHVIDQFPLCSQLLHLAHGFGMHKL
jgi:hypothetical protein